MTYVKFGPAGRPVDYNGNANMACSYIRSIGLDAYEYQATYGVKISEKSAIELKMDSDESDVLVSMHAPYYVNLSSNKDDVVERSIQRLVQAASASEWMGAYRTVFHPGFYTTHTPEEAIERCKNSITLIQEELEARGVKEYNLAPETTGKKSQLGSLDEIIEICSSFDHVEPTVDFAHVHARNNGCIKGKDDYSRIFTRLENELGLKTLHSHFTSIEYTDKGERKHHTLMEEDYGPALEPLMEVVAENGWNITLICETPLRDRDALVMKGVYEGILGETKTS